MLPEPTALPRALSFADVIVMPGGPLVMPDKVILETDFNAERRLKYPLLGLAGTVQDAITLAQKGLVGILSGDLSFSAQVDAVRQVKRQQAHLLRQPHTVTPDTNVAEAQDMQTRFHFSALPVVDPSSRKVVGIVTRADVAKAADPGDPVSSVMVTDLLTVREDAPDVEVKKILQDQMVGQVIVVDERGGLVGLRTASDYAKRDANPFANLDAHGRLLAGVAIAAGPEAQDRISAVLDLGADVILIAEPYAHSASVQELVTYIRRQRCEQKVTVIAGHVHTADGARALINAGADMLWLRAHDAKALESGVGVPGFTALQDVVDASSLQHVPVWIGTGLDTAVTVKSLVAGAQGVLAPFTTMDDVMGWTQRLSAVLGQAGISDVKDAVHTGRLASMR
jgi:IMP dehydrogenase